MSTSRLEKHRETFTKWKNFRHHYYSGNFTVVQIMYDNDINSDFS